MTLPACSVRVLLVRVCVLSLLVLALLPSVLCKKGHPKEHQHGDGRRSRNGSLYLALTRHTPHRPLAPPSPASSPFSPTSFSSTHDHLSSLLPGIASTAPLSAAPPRILRVDPAHFASVRSKTNVSRGAHGRHATAPSPSLVNLTDSYHVMYTAEMSIGTPPQRFHMILDTGSSCLWAISAQQSASSRPLPPFLHTYDHTRSSTYVADGASWDIQYGVGQCTGFLSRDTVALSPVLRVRNQSLAEAVELSSNFLNPQQPLDGIVGMSFAGGACQAEETFVEGLYREGRIGRRVFSFHLDTADSEEAINEVAIGEEEGEGSAEETIVYTDVLHAPHHAPAMWFVHLEAMSVVYPKGGSPVHIHNDSIAPQANVQHRRGEHRLDDGASGADDDSEEQQDADDDVMRVEERREASKRLRSFIAAHRSDAAVSSVSSDSVTFCGPSTGPCIALPDTGTSFLTLPTRLFILLISIITHGRDDCVIDALSNVFCLDHPHTLPSLAFTFHSHSFVLHPRDYILPNKQLALQVLDFGVHDVNIIILGDVFLRRVRVVFDEEQWRVGFVQRKGKDGEDEEQWVREQEEDRDEDVGGAWVALIMFALVVAVCVLCCCVCYDWCVRKMRRGGYEAIASAA